MCAPRIEQKNKPAGMKGPADAYEPHMLDVICLYKIMAEILQETFTKC